MAEEQKNKKLKNIGPKPKKSKLIYWVYALFFVVLIGLQFLGSGNSAKPIDWGNLKEMLQDRDVDKILLINKEKAEIFVKPAALESKDKYKDVKEINKAGNPQYYFVVASPESFENRVEEAQKGNDNPIYIQNENRREWGGEILSYLIPFIIMIVIWILIMRMMSRGSGGAGGQIFNIGKSKAQLFDKNTSVNVTFKDVAGLEEAKIEIMEIVDFLKNPKKYTELGGKIPKGALLVGPPGTGKTLLAKSVAGEANVPFFSMSGSDFVEMFVGVGASRVRDLFKQAKEKAPCIIFIDEIDAIGRARGKNAMTGGNDERENTLNQLLTEMDGFGTNAGVIILAATNRADILDRALMRAGRFDRQIHVELPDLTEREAIFKVHMRPIKLSKNLNPDMLAKQTPGFSGADIANVCNEAALIAARKNKKEVDRQDFNDAIDRIIGGLEKRNKIISIQEKKVIAFHEAGHATTSWLLKYAHPLVKVTIVPRGKALGAAWYLPEERQITTREQMFHEMIATLGGRASEQVIFGKISTGALNDLEKVTKQAYAMVTYYGLSDVIGNLSYYDSSGQNEYSFSKPFSEKTAEVIDQEIHNLVEHAYNEAIRILEENKDGLTQLAERLLDKEVIFSEDLESIFGDRPVDAVDNEKPKELSESKEQDEDSSKNKEEDNSNNEDIPDNNNEEKPSE
ncbi:MAG: ATP-dependent zinc metalloprotease FtsH [Bacteroidales bacterium]